MTAKAAVSEPHSQLEALLRAGRFAVTAEMQPSNGADPDQVRRLAAGLRGHVDAANCTDNPAARPHLSPLAAGRFVVEAGVEPIVQLTCRDRNRLGLQADLLGASALGARNVLLLTGDDVSSGDHPEARPIFDLDSLHLLRIARILRDRGTYLSGRPLTSRPSYFVGAVENPFAPPHDFRPVRLSKKVEAGAEFIQTQICFNLERMLEFMMEFAPDRRDSALDRRLAKQAERLYNLALLEAIATGRLDWSFPGQGRVRARLDGFPSSNHFVGVNYYSRVHIRFRGVPGGIGEYFYRDPAARGLTDTGWEIHPEGFDAVLRQAAQTGLPIVVTENGIATRDDRRRQNFLRDHALVMAHRREAGTRIDGYFHWSLLDNFEWLEGFGPRFGLYEVDYATFARRRRPSADLFAQLGRRFTNPAAAEGDESFAAAGR